MISTSARSAAARRMIAPSAAWMVLAAAPLPAQGPGESGDAGLAGWIGRAMHDRWFNSVQNHTVLRYVRGWERIDPDE